MTYKCCYTLYQVKCKWISLWAFKSATMYHHSSKGCKVLTCQSWRSKTNFKLQAKSRTYIIKHNLEPKISDFFQPPNLTGLNFTVPRPMMMHSSSFESPKNYSFASHLIKSAAALLGHVILAQSDLIYVVLIW